MATIETSQDIDNTVQRYFLQFLLTFRDHRDGRSSNAAVQPYYVQQVRRLMEEGIFTLLVDFQHLADDSIEGLDYNPHDFQAVVELHYFRVEPALTRALRTFVNSIDGAVTAWVNAATSNPFSVGFYNLPHVRTVRALRTKLLGQLQSICGTVTRTSDIKPELVVATFECPDCGREIPGVAQQFRLTEPVICTNPVCRNRRNFLLKPNLSHFVDWQKVRIQEHASDMPAGSIPRTVDVIVRGEMCDKTKAGDKIVLTGYLIVVPDVPALLKPGEVSKAVKRDQNKRGKDGSGDQGVTGIKSLGVRDLSYKVCFVASVVSVEKEAFGGSGVNGAESHAELPWNTGAGGSAAASGSRLAPIMMMMQDSARVMDQVMRNRLKQISMRPDVLSALASVIAPNVYGHAEVKKGVLLLLAGGIQKESRDGVKLRGDINLLIVGDPATAKSQFLKFVASHIGRSVYASGKSSTAAGLTASVSRDAEQSDVVIEPGALMLSDNGVCCIDEFDKMDLKDQVAIHEAMEQQTISISKAGVQAQMNSRCSILAAANPRYGTYDNSKSLRQNVNLSDPILSRFDLFFVVVDQMNQQADYDLARHVVGLRASGLSATSAGQNSEDQSPVTLHEFHEYLRMSKQLKPVITEPARAKICQYYTRMRQAELGAFRRSYRITVRQLESLIRLSEAVAKLHWSPEISVAHVNEAYGLLNGSIRKIDRGSITLADVPSRSADQSTDSMMDGEGTQGSPQVAYGGAQDSTEAQVTVGQTGGVNQTGGATYTAGAKRMMIGYAEYERIARMLAIHLEEEEAQGVMTTQAELIAWCIHEFADMFQSETQMNDTLRMLELVVNRLVDKDHILIVLQESSDKNKPQDRILSKHPNFITESGLTNTHYSEA